MNNQENVLSKLKLIWTAVFSSMILLTVILYLTQGNSFFLKFTANPQIAADIKSICYTLSIVLMPLAHFIYRKLVKRINPEIENITKYYNAKIVFFSVMEISGILTIIAFISDLKPESLIITVIVIVLLFLAKPTEEEFFKEFNIQNNEIDEIEETNETNETNENKI